MVDSEIICALLSSFLSWDRLVNRSRACNLAGEKEPNINVLICILADTLIFLPCVFFFFFPTCSIWASFLILFFFQCWKYTCDCSLVSANENHFLRRSFSHYFIYQFISYISVGKYYWTEYNKNYYHCQTYIENKWSLSSLSFAQITKTSDFPFS